MTTDYTRQLGAPENVTGEAFAGQMLDVHTCLPGIIEEFNPELQTATVTPAIKRILVKGEELVLPPCVDVPVYFMGSADFFITFKVSRGDGCLLLFSERCIDGWFETGQPSPPLDYRLHDLSDAFALIGVRAKPNAIASFANEGITLRNKQGDSTLGITDSGAVKQVTPGGWTELTPAGQFLINAPAGVWINGNTLVLGGITTSPANASAGEATFAGGVSAPSVDATSSLKVAGKEVNNHSHTNPEGGNVGGF